MHTNYKVQMEQFKKAYARPIKDIIEEVGSAWDSSFLMMPVNGIGPLPLVDEGRAIPDVHCMLDSRYCKLTSAQSLAAQAAKTTA